MPQNATSDSVKKIPIMIEKIAFSDVEAALDRKKIKDSWIFLSAILRLDMRIDMLLRRSSLITTTTASREDKISKIGKTKYTKERKKNL